MDQGKLSTDRPGPIRWASSHDPAAAMARPRLRHPMPRTRVLLTIALLPLLLAIAARAQSAVPSRGSTTPSPAAETAAPDPAAMAPAAKGLKGAQVYCALRAGGNSHEVSWTAAYAVIKRQPNDSPFKPSPEHASVMITEAVIANPTAFPDCSRYLGSMFEKPVAPASPR